MYLPRSWMLSTERRGIKVSFKYQSASKTILYYNVLHVSALNFDDFPKFNPKVWHHNLEEDITWNCEDVTLSTWYELLQNLLAALVNRTKTNDKEISSVLQCARPQVSSYNHSLQRKLRLNLADTFGATCITSRHTVWADKSVVKQNLNKQKFRTGTHSGFLNSTSVFTHSVSFISCSYTIYTQGLSHFTYFSNN